MRINDIIKPLLTEAKNMSVSEWMNSSSVPQFISRMLAGGAKNLKEPVTTVLTFRIGTVEYEGQIEINGPTDPNYRAAKRLQSAVTNKDKNILNNVDFTVRMLDDNGNLTKNVEKINVTKIVKDELFSGKLRVNKGNIAEIVLGCAVTAKYENPLEHIDASHVIDVARRVIKGNGTASGRAGKDALSFTVSVPDADKKGFASFIGMDPDGKTPEDYGMGKDLLKAITAHIDNAVRYVNTSPRVSAAIEKASKDPRKNEIEIKSDGGNAEEQKTTKADLKILIDGSSINLLSIKAGDVGQFGQVSGYQFERLNDFFLSSVNIPLSNGVKEKFVAMDEKLSSKEEMDANRELVRTTNYKTGFKIAYDEIFNQLNQLTGSIDGQADLIKRVYKGLLYHATRNDSNVEMIILSPNAKKAFHELTFGPELEKALDDYQLTVRRGTTSAMYEIYIYGYPKTSEVKKEQGTSKELLIKLRSYAQKKAVRNIIEMGDLLKDIADWEKIEERKAKKVAGAPKADDHLKNARPQVPPAGPSAKTHQPSAQTTNLQGTEFSSQPIQKPMVPKFGTMNKTDQEKEYFAESNKSTDQTDAPADSRKSRDVEPKSPRQKR